MIDDLEHRLTRALTRHVEGASADAPTPPPAAAVAATARRRTARRRQAAGALAIVTLLGVAATARLANRDRRGTVEVASRGVDDRRDHPVATTGPEPSTASVEPTTTVVAPTTTESSSSTVTWGGTAVTTPEYQPLAWFPVVDGVQVAWQADGEVTTTWTRSGTAAPRARGIEGRDPRAFVVPTGDRSLVVIVFEGPDDEPPTQASVAADEATPTWAEVTWDPVASVGWARLTWTGDEPPTEAVAVELR